MPSKKDSFQPVIPASKTVNEFTFRALILGLVLGLIFGVGNAYLGLKVGTTVSASIPAAVLSIAFLRFFGKDVTILENNIVQTIASVGEGLAGGVVFTIPALYILKAPEQYVSPSRVFILASLGGILGVLFMIPMRRFIIVEQHGKLPFPEGTACAKILKSARTSASEAPMALWGIGVGAFYKVLSSVMSLWRETPTWVMKRFENTIFSMDCTPALLGVGFIIGPRIASVMFAGGALTWWVLIPLVTFFGGNSVIPPLTDPMSQLSAQDIWSHYIRYIGAGAVATGGLLSMFKIGPMIGKSIHVGVKELFSTSSDSTKVARTERDISMKWLILGSLAIILTLSLLPGRPLDPLTIVLLVILGFFFVAVTSLTVGIVGSTSNPVSGMTITTLLLTCLIFWALKRTGETYLFGALTMGCVANVAISLAGTTSQDLKTGFLVGATPKYQQIGEIFGIVIPAIFIGGVVYVLNDTYEIGSSNMPAPQGMMMALIAKGVINQQLPIVLVVLGVILGLIVELLKLPVLPFAIGLYLPLSLTTPVMFGGFIAWIFQKMTNKDEHARERGVLVASGLIAGDACMGVVIAFMAFTHLISKDKMPLLPDWTSIFVFALLAVWLVWYARREPRQDPNMEDIG